ncbi:MAG: hypothetical protein JW864_04530 [Spirochaetes bacterium]|nr:hypothetical protein [Spirochaetota bacterium]
MQKKKYVFFLGILITCFFLSGNNNVFSTEINYTPIEVLGLTRYTEDRVAFQHIQIPAANEFFENDTSLASLLIVKNNQVYLFRDGYDDSAKIKMETYVMELRRELPKDLWINKVNSKPDYIKITDRKSEKMLNVKEEFVEKNFGDFYRNVRNSFIQKHVKVFYQLMRNRTESGLYLDRQPISPPAFQEVKEPAKYSMVVKAKAINDLIYFAEDADGDGVTETFYVNYDDGFNWGFKSGPNIIFIYKNKEEDIKQLIGKLCYSAYYGTEQEEKNILKTFPKDSEIIEAFKLEEVAIQTEKEPDSSTGKN